MTNKTAYTFFIYFATDLQIKLNGTDGFFKTEQNPRLFSKLNRNRTELEKYILHIPRWDSVKGGM